MRANALGFRQFVAHDVTRQIGVQRLAPTLEAFVSCHVQRGIVASGAVFQRWRGLCRRCQGLGLIEEYVLLLGAARFALGGEDLAHHLVEPLLEQVALIAHKAQLRSQCFPLRKCCLQVLLESREFFDCGLQRHCSF